MQNKDDLNTLVRPKTLYANAQTLASTLRSARGGDRIVLSGDFGFMKLYGMNYASTVTIDATAARFKDTMVITGASNVAFIGGVYGTATSSTKWGRVVQVYNSMNIGFDKAQFIGFNGNGGFNFKGVNGGYVVNSSFSNFGAAGAFEHVVGGTLSNNFVANSTRDGFDIIGSQNISASHNSCIGSTPAPGAHPDCIQIWSTTGSLSAHIALTDNLVYGNTQGFTKFDSGGTGSDITITGNVVETKQTQGIACYGCFNSNISNNQIVMLKSSPHFVNINVIGGGNNKRIANSWIYAPSDAFINPTGEFAAAGVLTGMYAPAPSFASTTLTSMFSSAAVMAVPEPSLWATLIIGFGLHGMMMRRRRTQTLVTLS